MMLCAFNYQFAGQEVHVIVTSMVATEIFFPFLILRIAMDSMIFFFFTLSVLFFKKNQSNYNYKV